MRLSCADPATSVTESVNVQQGHLHAAGVHPAVQRGAGVFPNLSVPDALVAAVRGGLGGPLQRHRLLHHAAHLRQRAGAERRLQRRRLAGAAQTSLLSTAAPSGAGVPGRPGVLPRRVAQARCSGALPRRVAQARRPCALPRRVAHARCPGALPRRVAQARCPGVLVPPSALRPLPVSGGSVSAFRSSSLAVGTSSPLDLLGVPRDVSELRRLPRTGMSQPYAYARLHDCMWAHTLFLVLAAAVDRLRHRRHSCDAAAPHSTPTAPSHACWMRRSNSMKAVVLLGWGGVTSVPNTVLLVLSSCGPHSVTCCMVQRATEHSSRDEAPAL